MRREALYEILFDLRKSYNALERYRHMEILVGYVVGLHTKRIIQHYWDHLSMVFRSGRYYITLFKVHRWVT